MLFSKKPFPVFLESAGFSEKNVLLQKPKAGVSKSSCDFMFSSFGVMKIHIVFG